MDATLDSASVPKPDAKERLFQCSTCKRSFIRVDHLMRHVRSHTKQRPYVCPTCSKTFARVDLLKRHIANHSSENVKKRSRSNVRPSRAVQACEACSRSHLRCEDEKPCSRCRQKNIECKFEFDAAQDFDAARDLLDFSNEFHINPPHVSSPNTTIESTIQENLQEVTMNVEQHDIIQREDTEFTNTGASTMQIAEPSMVFMHDAAPSFSEESPGDQSLPDFLRYMPPLDAALSGTATPRGLLDFSFNWDLDFGGFDFGSLDQPFTQENLNDNTRVPDMQVVDQPAHERTTHEIAVAVRAEAFNQSVWRYVPKGANPTIAEQSNLALPNGESDNQSPSQMPSRAITKERLSYTTRDKLLAIVLDASSTENAKRIAGGFPSLELLDGLVQIFFVNASINALPWIHLPTFSPAEVHPLLLACIAAAGAFYSPEALLQNLGLALHEAARHGLAKTIEQDNSLIRDLQYLQIQLIMLETGMWSGISRKMEIAESFLQPPITMLRRGGRFGRSIWRKITPTMDDTGQVLETKWKEWVLQESWLRIVYRFFECDCQSSLALLKPPLISYAEMKLPLPYSDFLWHAPSASAWKAAYLASSITTTRRPTLYDCMEDLDHVSQYSIGGTAYLYMIWGMIWEYRQITALTAKTHFANDLLLASRHQDLTKLCEDSRVSQVSSTVQVEIILEALLMHLNAPLDDVQTFAGIAGPDEAKYAYTTLRDWASTGEARQSLLHASRILQLSESLPRNTLQNFYAMTVYHAGLVLWVYGLLKRTSGANTLDPDRQTVILGGKDDRDVKKFIKVNRGEPAIRSEGLSVTVLLRNASDIMGLVLQLLRRNHDYTNGGYPRLVDSLVQLMTSLQSASK